MISLSSLLWHINHWTISTTWLKVSFLFTGMNSILFMICGWKTSKTATTNSMMVSHTKLYRSSKNSMGRYLECKKMADLAKEDGDPVKYEIAYKRWVLFLSDPTFPVENATKFDSADQRLYDVINPAGNNFPFQYKLTSTITKNVLRFLCLIAASKKSSWSRNRPVRRFSYMNYKWRYHW